MSLEMRFRHHLDVDSEIIHVKVFWESHKFYASCEFRYGIFGVKHGDIEVASPLQNLDAC